jgi:hypothetical protein
MDVVKKLSEIDSLRWQNLMLRIELLTREHKALGDELVARYAPGSLGLEINPDGTFIPRPKLEPAAP